MTQEEIRTKAKEIANKIKNLNKQIEHCHVDLQHLYLECEHPSAYYGTDRTGSSEMSCPDCGKST